MAVVQDMEVEETIPTKPHMKCHGKGDTTI